MHAFIGTVPFTIIEAMNFVISNNIKDADIYVVKVFNGADKICSNLRKTGFFKNVYLVEDVLLTYPITVKKCLKIISNGRKFQKEAKKRVYEAVYYNNSGWLINSIFYNAFYKANKQIKNIFLEHGYYSYTNNYSDKTWRLKAMINLVGLKCMDGSMIDELYMYRPEIMKMKHTGELKKMPLIDKNNKDIVEALNAAFDYENSSDEYSSKDIIIMEQGPQKFEFDKEKFWDKVLSVLDSDKMIIKAHPRQKNSTLHGKGIDVSKNHTLPWEIEVLNTDLNSKYQITIFSGSCVSPKLMFDDEPTVIFLYKLVPVDSSVWSEEMIGFANDVGSLYINKDKYFVPETFDEFKEYCEKHNISRK